MDTIQNGDPNTLGKRLWHEEDSPWKAQKIFQVLERNDVRPSTVGEIGCGAGGVLYNLASYYNENVEFYGYETSKEGFELSKIKESKNIHYFNEDLLKVDRYYDVVMAINVFTHVRDYLGFLSKLRTKGEYKVFHIPLQVTLYYVMRSRYFQKKEYIRSHYHHFNKETALGTLKGTGYEIIDYFYTAASLDLPNRGQKENLWNLPRKLLYAIDKDFAAKTIGGFSLMVLTK